MSLPPQTSRMYQRPRSRLNSSRNCQLHHIQLPPPEPLRLPDKCRSTVPRGEAVYHYTWGTGFNFLRELAEHEDVEQFGGVVAVICAGGGVCAECREGVFCFPFGEVGHDVPVGGYEAETWYRTIWSCRVAEFGEEKEA